MAGGNWKREFKEPMTWATDEQLRILRRELEQEAVKLRLIESCVELAKETTGLLSVEREISLRGMS